MRSGTASRGRPADRLAKIVLAVIIPTFNEADSLPVLLERLHASMQQAGVSYEAVVVDDNSPDGTGDIAEGLASKLPVRVLHRPQKAGLASAVLDGMGLTSAELIGVMDADLSHPPDMVPRLTEALENTSAQLAVGSRYVPGGGMEDWPLRRRVVSMVANWMTRLLTPVHDATSGFFVIRRSALEGVTLNPIGFKIGLEVMARANYDSFVEVPYIFTDRKHGHSKFGRREVAAFLKQLAILHWERIRRHKPWPRDAAQPRSAESSASS